MHRRLNHFLACNSCSQVKVLQLSDPMSNTCTCTCGVQCGAARIWRLWCGAAGQWDVVWGSGVWGKGCGAVGCGVGSAVWVVGWGVWVVSAVQSGVAW